MKKWRKPCLTNCAWAIFHSLYFLHFLHFLYFHLYGERFLPCDSPLRSAPWQRYWFSRCGDLPRPILKPIGHPIRKNPEISPRLSPMICPESGCSIGTATFLELRA